MDQFSANNQFVDNKKSKWYKVPKFYAYIFLLCAFFIAGMAAGTQYQEPQTSEQVIKQTSQELKSIFFDNEEIDTELFEEVWTLLHDEYLEKSGIDDQDLFYGAISGMVEALGDPHTLFFNPELTKDFSQELEGSFFGIGAEIGRREGFVVIIAPLANTPADLAGLKPGDKILAVDGKDIIGMSTNEAVTYIRGDKGTEVILTIFSKGAEVPRDVSIIRDKIDIPSVIYRLEDNIAIVEITHFNDDTDERFAKVVQQILNNDATGVIIDLRNNPGGYLSTSVDIASYWLEPNSVVVRETFSDKRNDRDYKATKKTSLSHLKTIVLVNEGSASASEILAGALQDYEIAEIVGMTTFGKGSVQQLMELKDDSSIKLTVARWLTPNGRTIESEGILPDYEVDFSLEDYENEIDPQLDRAKELIFE
ncbi:MAG: S41 family peptidase [Candidatus Komeilibacteria bacterium]|jgi:carboxyl-terminal processing protease|nr:S41 family peptidase [Candidatus Komeilibacteria bacterium]